MPWDSSEEQMGGGPREMRIHVQRVIAIPAPHNMPPPPETMGPFAPPPPPPPQGHDQNEVSITYERDKRISYTCDRNSLLFDIAVRIAC